MIKTDNEGARVDDPRGGKGRNHCGDIIKSKTADEWGGLFSQAAVTCRPAGAVRTNGGKRSPTPHFTEPPRVP